MKTKYVPSDQHFEHQIIGLWPARGPHELRGPIQKLYIGPALHVRNAGSQPRSRREFLILRSVAGVVQRPPSRTGFPLSCPFNILHYTRGTIRERVPEPLEYVGAARYRRSRSSVLGLPEIAEAV